MPELCRFFGIIVRMYAEFGAPHHKPHFHAYYQEQVAVFGVKPLAILSRSLPKRQRRLVEAWAEIHSKELMDDWLRLQTGRKPNPIKPLK